MFINILRVTFLLRWSDASGHVTTETRAVISRVFIRGVATFVFGFFVWNLDNIFCDTLTRWKVNIGWPIAFLLEGGWSQYAF
jgi:dihydroceramidase